MLEGIAYVDIGVIVIILIFVISGMRKGFVGSLLGLIGLIASIFVAIHFASALAGVLQEPVGKPVNNWINKGIVSALNPEDDPGNVFAADLSDEEEVSGLVTQALEKIKLPKVFADIIAPKVTEAVTTSLPEEGETSIIGIFTSLLGQVVLLIISALILFIGARIILAIIEAIFKAILSTSKTLRGLDRLLGAVVGIAKSAIALMVIFMITTFILSGVVPDENGTDLKVKIRTNIENSSISKFVYDSNPLPGIIAQYISIEDILGNTQPSPEGEQEENEEDASIKFHVKQSDVLSLPY